MLTTITAEVLARPRIKIVATPDHFGKAFALDQAILLPEMRVNDLPTASIFAAKIASDSFHLHELGCHGRLNGAFFLEVKRFVCDSLSMSTEDTVPLVRLWDLAVIEGVSTARLLRGWHLKTS